MAMPVCVMFRLMVFQVLVMLKTSLSVSGTLIVFLRSSEEMLPFLAHFCEWAPFARVLPPLSGKTCIDARHPMFSPIARMERWKDRWMGGRRDGRADRWMEEGEWMGESS